MVEDVTIIPHIAVHPDRISFYNEVKFEKPRSSKHDCSGEDFHYGKNSYLKNFRSNNNKGRISLPAKRKIEKAVNYLNLISERQKVYVKEIGKSIDFKLTFVTLTLPSRQIHSDQQIRRDCMHHFLTVAERKWNVKRYICRSERQENGNLHFHFVCQNFIPHQELRDTWNNIINKLDYVNEYRASMKEWHISGFKIRKDLIKYWPVKSQKKAYLFGIATDWNCPNSTDIHSLRFIQNIPAYICKYMSKRKRLNSETISGKIKGHDKNYFKLNPSTTPNVKNFLKANIQCGRLWSCSTDLSDLRGGQGDIDSGISQELKKIADSHKARLYEKEYCKVLFCNIDILKELKCIELLKLINEFLGSRFDYNIQLTI
jgi:hypothetical protein